MHIQEKNKKLNIHHLRSAIGVMVTLPSQAPVLVNVQLVMAMVRLDLIKVFSPFNRLVLNVMGMGRKLQTHVMIVMVKVKNRLQKKYQLPFQKVSMMELGLD